MKLKDCYSIEDIRKSAIKRIPFVASEYLECGTGSEDLLIRNRQELDKILFTPEFCKGSFIPSTSVRLFGESYSVPFGIAPIGLSGLVWPKSEISLAKTAKTLNFPFTLSTVATETPEAVSNACNNLNNGWFQLYPPKDLTIRDSLLERAKKAGFKVLVVTADVPMPSERERSKRAGAQVPLKFNLKFIFNVLLKPAWLFSTLIRGVPRLRTVHKYTNNNSLKFVSGFVGNRLGGSLDWIYCKELIEAWNGPTIIKGILSEKDLEKAIEVGFDGVYVSNHGGRQFDGGKSSIESLKLISKANKGRVKLIFDSGVRSGLDIMRALHCGADFVMLGRPFMYGVAADFKEGPKKVFEILRNGLINNMAQIGVKNIEEFKR